MQEADPNRDMTGVLSPAFQKDIGDPLLWRLLHERSVGLSMLFRDRQNDTWHAHAVYPWLSDDKLPYWSPDYDERAHINASGPSAAEAVSRLFDHARFKPSDSVGFRLAALAVEVTKLTDVLRERH